MTIASISDLKANRSRYLRVVRRGGEVQVLDRGAPVARLVPPTANDDEGGPGASDRQRDIAAGQGKRRCHPGQAAAGAAGESVGSVGRGSDGSAVRYWDASPLVPVVVAEPDSKSGRARLSEDDHIVRTMTKIIFPCYGNCA